MFFNVVRGKMDITKEIETKKKETMMSTNKKTNKHKKKKMTSRGKKNLITYLLHDVEKGNNVL
jgi:hypothetical protein